MLPAAALASVRLGYELGLYGLFALVLWRTAARVGWERTLRELGFGFALSQGVELLAVSFGRYRYPDWLLYFPPQPAWVPLGVGLGWAVLVPCVMRMSDVILGPDARPWRAAGLDGLMAVGLDLVIDPAVSGEPLRMWIWRGAGMTPYRAWLLDVPVFNFVGWVMLVGACSYQLRRAQRLPTPARRWRHLLVCLVLDGAMAAGVMLLPW